MRKIINSQEAELKLLWVAFLMCFVLTIAEFIMALYSRSQSVLIDAVYDMTELVIIGLSLILNPYLYKPFNEKRPFGYAQLESVFIIVKGLILIIVTLGLSVNCIQLLISGGNSVDGNQIGLFQFVMGIICFFVYIFMKKINKDADVSSPTSDMEINSWKLDVYYSFGMAGAFLGSTLLKETQMASYMPYFDLVVTLLIVLFMLPGTVKLTLVGIKDVFLFAPEKGIIENIKMISEETLSQYFYETIFFEVTRTGRKLWIGVYFKTNQSTISIGELKEATIKLTNTLAEVYDDVDVNLILEPLPEFYKEAKAQEV